MLVGTQVHAAYPAQFYTFLGKYLSQSEINTTTFYNQSVGNFTYVIINLKSGNYALINTTNGMYSFVLDNSTAYAVLSPFSVVHFYPSNQTLQQLNSTMNAYERTAAPPITSCLQETGLTSGSTCTLTNGCQSCQTVPICRKLASAVGTSVYTGIINLSSEYRLLNASYRLYFSSLAGINTTNAYTSLQAMQGATNNISIVATTLPKNLLFPLPPGIPPSNFSKCSSYVTGQGPWYCYSLGFCYSLSFNSTVLKGIQTTISGILAQPISSPKIHAFANLTVQYDVVLLTPQYRSQISALITLYSNQYNATTKNATALLAQFYNPNLNSSLKSLQATYAQLVDYNYRKNASTYNTTLKQQFANLSSIYTPLAQQYSTLQAISTNNTATIILRELDFQTEPSSLAVLASQQQSINVQLSNTINSSAYSSIYAQLTSVKSGLGAYHPYSFASFTKAVDGGVVSAILAGSNAPIPSKQGTAPFYVLLISALFVAVIIVVIYFTTFYRLGRRRRLHLHRKARQAWLFLFIALAVIGGIISYLNYTFAAQANTFLPIDGFLGQLSSHSNAVIAFNSTAAAANQSLQQCASSLQATLNSTHKTVHTITMQNYTCTSGGPAGCFDAYLGNGTPVIVLGQGADYILYKGMYGHALYAAGFDASGRSCYLNTVIKVG